MKPRNIVESITDPTKNFFAAFVVGTLVFTIISDGVSSLFWEMLQNHLETEDGWLSYNWLRFVIVGLLAEDPVFGGSLGQTLIVFLLAVTYLTSFTRWAQRHIPFFRPPLQTNVKRLTTPYPGLIVAMSPRENSPAEAVIRFHWNGGQESHLKYCWIICTDKSLPYAKQMMQRFTEEGMTQSVQFHFGSYAPPNIYDLTEPITLLVPNNKIDDPNHIQMLVNSIYVDAALKDLDSSEVIADYTGATKGMTAGILLACTEPDHPLQYISQLDCEIMAIHVSYKLTQTS